MYGSILRSDVHRILLNKKLTDSQRLFDLTKQFIWIQKHLSDGEVSSYDNDYVINTSYVLFLSCNSLKIQKNFINNVLPESEFQHSIDIIEKKTKGNENLTIKIFKFYMEKLFQNGELHIHPSYIKASEEAAADYKKVFFRPWSEVIDEGVYEKIKTERLLNKYNIVHKKLKDFFPRCGLVYFEVKNTEKIDKVIKNISKDKDYYKY
ncbi:hypothetical protein ACFL04_04550 [Patescibacteria group bacterium]